MGGKNKMSHTFLTEMSDEEYQKYHKELFGEEWEDSEYEEDENEKKDTRKSK